MNNQQIVFMIERHIKCGDFENSQWHILKGLDSVQDILARLRWEINWEGYSLWIHGNILNDVYTHDIDLTITGPEGPPDSSMVNNLLESCVRIGFESQIFIDVKYSVHGDLYYPKKHISKTVLYACYRPSIEVDGKKNSYAMLQKDLYLKTTKYPMGKTMGKLYPDPIQII